MNKEEAMQHGLGYASGREDASNVRTVDLAGPDETRMGWMRFAERYAQGWDEFNDVNHPRFSMTNCRDAYDTWQASGGVTIFSDEWRKMVAETNARMAPKRS